MFGTELLRSLVARGHCGVQLAISDARPGLKAAIARSWVAVAALHRAVLRNPTGHCSTDQHDALGALIRPDLHRLRMALRQAGASLTRSASSSPGCRRSLGC